MQGNIFTSSGDQEVDIFGRWHYSVPIIVVHSNFSPQEDREYATLMVFSLHPKEENLCSPPTQHITENE